MVTIPEPDRLRHRDRFRQSVLGANPQGDLICCIDVDEDKLRETVRQALVGTTSLFQCRITAAGRLRLLEVIDEPPATHGQQDREKQP